MNTDRFEWSCTRKRRFEFCLRAYFLRYVAQLDDERLAPTTDRPLAFYRRLKTQTGWVRGLLLTALETVLSEAALKGRQASGDDLRRAAMSLVNRDTFLLRRRAWQEDHKTLCLKEIHYGESTTEETIRRGREKLLSLVELFARCRLFEELASLPFNALKPVAKPESFDFEGTTLWTSPDLSWTAEGRHWIVCLSLGDEDNDGRWSLRMGVNTLSRIARCGGWESRIVGATVFFNAGDALPVYARTSRGETERVMREDIENALSKHKAYDARGIEAFMPVAEFGKCAACPFREICEAAVLRLAR